MRNESENIKRELDELGASFLLNHKKENAAFQPPVHYFDELPQNVQSHISSRKKMLALPQILRWSPAFALILIALFATLYIMVRKNTRLPDGQASVQNNNTVAEVKIEQPAPEITTQDILLEEIDEDILVEALASAETVAAKKQDKKPVVKTAEKQEIEEYILENVDEYFLIEEL